MQQQRDTPTRSSWALVMIPRNLDSLTGKWVALALPGDQVTQRRAERVLGTGSA